MQVNSLLGRSKLYETDRVCKRVFGLLFERDAWPGPGRNVRGISGNLLIDAYLEGNASYVVTTNKATGRVQTTATVISSTTRFTRNVPEWFSFDYFAGPILTRIAWTIGYVLIYVWLATAWWQWLFLPATLLMAPIHGAIINWFAHKVGYRSFEMNNTSTNFLPFDFLMLGESYHNNHHKHDKSANFGVRWFELDLTYVVIKIFNRLGIIQLNKSV